jgi:hypothetical protein
MSAFFPTVVTADMELDSLVVLDPFANPKNGQKSAMITKHGKPVIWTMPGEAQPLWQPSMFKTVSGDSAGRLSLCVSGEPELLKEASLIDTWAVNYASEHSERLFGKKLNVEQVKMGYNGVLKENEKYPPFVKIKLGNEKNAPKFWDIEKKQRDPPEDFSQCQMRCNVRLMSFWFMQTSWGLTAQLQDALINNESPVVCPF